MSTSSHALQSWTRQQFQEALKHYPVAITTKINSMKKPDTTFRTLDQEVRSHFFTLQNVKASEPQEIKDKMLKIVKWKLTRGQFRPTLYAQASSNPPEQMHKLMIAMLEYLNNVRPDGPKEDPEENKKVNSQMPCLLCETSLFTAVNILMPLKGFGVATITAVLSQVELPRVSFKGETTGKHFPLRGICPFMADEALMIVNGKMEYTPKACKSFIDAVLTKWIDLFGKQFLDEAANKTESGRRRDREGEGNKEKEKELLLTPAELSHAMYSFSFLKKHGV